MVYVTISLLIGMALGQRFKVLVLVPGSMLMCIVAIAGGIARGDSVQMILLISAELIASLQIGYLVGTGIYHLLVAPRASRPNADALGGSITARRPVH